MKLLLDTNVLYWWMTNSGLDPAIASAINDPANRVALSAASIWEMSIKAAKGKLILEVDVEATLDAARIEVLQIDIGSALAVRSLPHHHGDPFDRLIIAQAQLGGFTIVTSDKVFDKYDVKTLAA